MEKITREVAESCADVVRVNCDIPEGEPIIIFSIAGRRTEGCGRACEGCSRYSECFPKTNPQEEVTWERFLRQLLQGGEKEG